MTSDQAPIIATDDDAARPSLTGADGQDPIDANPSSFRQMTEMAVGIAFAPIAIAQQVLPRSQPVFYFGGLAALAVAGVVDVPVAAVIAAGVWVAGQPGSHRNSTVVA